MKKLTQYIFTFMLVLFAYTASAQRYSLYYTKTLYDGIQNPHHKSLDSCRSWATNFIILPSFSLDFRITGDANNFIKSFLASENLSDLKFDNGTKYTNEISNKFNYNLFMLKIRMGRKRDAELSLYSQIKLETAFNINNGLFNFLTQGNYAYRGKTIEGFMDIGGLANAYTETGIGFRRQIYKNLSGGFKVGYLLGAANATFDIKGSKFTTSANGDTVDITLKGTVKSSIDPDKTGDIVKNITKNTGTVFSGGLQYDIGRKATVSVAILDLGFIKWNENSRIYNLDKTVRYIGVPALSDSAFQDSVIKDLTKFAIDSSYGSYTSPLLTRIEFSANYRWANWFQNTLIVSKPLDFDNIDLTFIADLRIVRRINFIALGTYNTSGFSSVGAQFLYRAKGIDFYFGSEKILNTYQVSQQLADHTKKPSLGLGADFNFGMALGFGRCPKPKAPVIPLDTDGDGVIDALDNCPYKAGPPENRGCPYSDTDNDGVLDKDDACPTVAGPIENAGCPWPDADGDSIPDKDDLCPTQSGKLMNKGCPDTDSDGVYDKDDACPALAGPAENIGCPYLDSDSDSTLDKDDRCPNVAGPVSNGGCPLTPQKVELSVEEQEVINKVFSNLNFETGKSVIAASSFVSLDALYELMVKKPSFKVLIEGHTDNAGKVESNKKLSQARADAVKKYLEDKGIDGTRITAKGFGSSKPVADNKTPEGKAKNRRVEFTILEG